MPKLNFRLDESLHAALLRRALGANLSLSGFIRQLLEQAVDERKRYVFSSQDEILATSIQILSIVATSVGQQSPEALEQGMAQARIILAERGLLGGEDIP
ncbi:MULTISPECIES: CopG family transcriptional regulator [unclassified Sphingobium]|uniref:CopG family transcriptional regulator n=1 Tax=unclassified Sphingobium TaxID=2611147 RepID=UPI000DB6011E|nr:MULTISPECIES: CopG family transcriptional regulator [unclassified Sphingobium]PZU05360.1 MAG: CopG family transcriptional regulator [Sphingobium sp.]BBD02143.1 RHH-type transcriptional regulator, rel operon repressor/antitoxin RelB [Sphingobium sp. YG1]